VVGQTTQQVLDASIFVHTTLASQLQTALTNANSNSVPLISDPKTIWQISLDSQIGQVILKGPASEDGEITTYSFLHLKEQQGNTFPNHNNRSSTGEVKEVSDESLSTPEQNLKKFSKLRALVSDLNTQKAKDPAAATQAVQILQENFKIILIPNPCSPALINSNSPSPTALSNSIREWNSHDFKRRFDLYFEHR